MAELDNAVDIYSKNPWPANELSNFAAHDFVMDGVPCASMEGFLQALTHSDVNRQREVCALVGLEAKEAASPAWKETQDLHWQGKIFGRGSGNYQSLLDRAYSALFMASDSFREALEATGLAVLTHKSGGFDPAQTILTEEEFCTRLMDLRERFED